MLGSKYTKIAVAVLFIILVGVFIVPLFFNHTNDTYFKLTGIQLCAQGRDECNTTFYRGESLYLRGAVSYSAPNLSRSMVVEELKLTGPEGMVMEGERLKISGAKFSANFKQYFQNNIDLPVDIKPGKYILTVKFTDKSNSNKVEQKINFIISDKMAITKMIFASSIDSAFNYVVQPNAAYLEGTNAYLYIKVNGFTQKKTENGYSIDLVQDLYVYGSDGNKIDFLSVPAITEVKEVNHGLRSKVEFADQIPLNLMPGLYKAVVVVHDKNSGMIANKSLYFEVINGLTGAYKFDTIHLSDIQSGDKLQELVNVYDSSGRELVELRSNKTSFADMQMASTDSYPVMFIIPPRYPAGHYTIKYLLKNLRTGEIVSKQITLLQKKELQIRNWLFADKSMQPQPNRIYKPGDKVIFYFELTGFNQLYTNGRYNVALTGGYRLYDSSGKSLIIKDDVTDINDNNFGLKDYYGMTYSFILPKNIKPGRYSLVINLKDKHSLDELSKEFYFWVD